MARPRSASFLIVPGLLLAGCVMDTLPAACASSPEAPLLAELEVEDACAFYAEGSPVRLALVSWPAHPHVEADVTLPPGVELVSGSFRYAGPLEERGRLEREAIVRAATPGDHRLTGWVRVDPDTSGPSGPGSAWGLETNLLVRGNATAASTERALDYLADFDVALSHEPGNATRLVATFESPVPTRARATLYFSWPPLGFAPPGYDPHASPPQRYPVTGHPEWSGVRVWQGDVVRNAHLLWEGTLEAGVPLVLRFHAPLPESTGGPWTVGAYLATDPAVDARVVYDESDFWFDGREARMTERTEPEWAR